MLFGDTVIHYCPPLFLPPSVSTFFFQFHVLLFFCSPLLSPQTGVWRYPISVEGRQNIFQMTFSWQVVRVLIFLTLYYLSRLVTDKGSGPSLSVLNVFLSFSPAARKHPALITHVHLLYFIPPSFLHVVVSACVCFFSTNPYFFIFNYMAVLYHTVFRMPLLHYIFT